VDDVSLTSQQRAQRWNAAYSSRGVEGVSWYQDVPAISLELIEALRVPRTAGIIDIGGGASPLAGCLVDRGYADVTVLDFSTAALEDCRRRIRDEALVAWLAEDLLTWDPQRSYELWHDRAVFHFLVDENDRQTYLRALHAALSQGGSVIIATFAADGPDSCSGLPVARYSADDLAQVLGEMFVLVETRREVHLTPRGAPQPFTWIAGRLNQA
jgi:SAM-dependent methyltransferase